MFGFVIEHSRTIVILSPNNKHPEKYLVLEGILYWGGKFPLNTKKLFSTSKSILNSFLNSI